MRIVVTGGAGFIGSHLCARLLGEGHEVVCVDNLRTGSALNLATIQGDARFTWLNRDVSDLAQPLLAMPELAEGPVDAIFHLASPASPRGYLRMPVETALANSQGTYACLELARAKQARFLLASTSEAYGDPLEHPQRETYWGNVNPIGQRACYDESKRFAEALTFVYLRTHGVDARVVRIFNCYGPHSDPEDGRLVPSAVTRALRGEPIVVYGSGEQTRSLCYVDDLVEGLVRAAWQRDTRGEVFNLGMPDERSVREIVALVNRLCGHRSPITFGPPISEDDPQRRCPDIAKARRVLSWEPGVPLEDGLARTIAWFARRLDLPLPEASPAEGTR
ncbi:MAG TPA: NAD-dependent epimerase/dehydratase family protein [Chloroflexota bacterium]|jgi:nucleoside-diphosphate-sugar epimerase|nr:NAD-dependent epimerase/dehydratase family protein [Chloroflexota bacterium]